MSDSGKLDKPASQAVPKTSEPEAAPNAIPGLPSWSEIQYRATGGKEGTAPLERVMSGRQAVGASVMQRLAIMRKVGGAADVGAQPKVPEGTGAPLDGDIRAKMEPKLGADLSGVRVHTSGESAQAAKGFGARAFTVGNDVHFNSGQFAPGTKEGDKLLAHELTHVVQGQKSGLQRKEAPDPKGAEAGEGEHKVSQPGESAEVEADSVSEKVADGLHDQDEGHDEKKEATKKDAKQGEKKDEKKAPAEQKAPPIAAKLEPNAVSRAKGGPAPAKQIASGEIVAKLELNADT